ncbi:MAG: monooxygenase [Euzebyales bacterium]|nr:monooxygenase [Euzebyales bacterium]
MATLHLFGVSGSGVARALLRMGLDRVPLSSTPGLRFSKLLGTGSGRTFTLRDADPRRWGLFAVWDHAGALDAFEAVSPVPRAWAGIADERWRAELAGVRSRGRWAGRDPLASALWTDAPADASVAVLTRARIRSWHSLAFWRAVPPVSADLRRQPGLRYAIGIGEAPLGLQATFSVWRSNADLTAYAYARPQHREVIRRTRDEGWYAEELFSRFAVLATEGSVDGVDPLG